MLTPLHVALGVLFGLAVGVFFAYSLAVITGDLPPEVGRVVSGWRAAVVATGDRAMEWADRKAARLQTGLQLLHSPRGAMPRQQASTSIARSPVMTTRRGAA